MLVYEKGEDALRPYRQFIVDPVLIYFHPEGHGFGVEPETLVTLARYFRDAVVESLEKGGVYKLVQEPGPGVARVRGAITDVKSVKFGITSKAAIIAATSVLIAPGVGLLFPNINVGEAAIEFEILDSVSKERLLAGVDRKKGRRFLNLKGSTNWGDVKRAFKGWAKAFRKHLDTLHGAK